MIILIATTLIGILNFFIYFLFAVVIASWLLAFGIIKPQHTTAIRIIRTLNRVTNPILSPIRKIVPPIFGLDFSIIIAFFTIEGLKIAIIEIVTYIL